MTNSDRYKSSAVQPDPYDLFLLNHCYVISTYYPKDMNVENYESCSVTTEAYYIGKHQGKYLFKCKVGGGLISFTDAQLYGENFLKVEDACNQESHLPLQLSEILK